MPLNKEIVFITLYYIFDITNFSVINGISLTVYHSFNHIFHIVHAVFACMSFSD